MKATLEEVENGVAEYLHRVIDGETVVVYRGDRPVAEIRSVTEADTLRCAYGLQRRQLPRVDRRRQSEILPAS